jgi:hypothetical protein
VVGRGYAWRENGDVVFAICAEGVRVLTGIEEMEQSDDGGVDQLRLLLAQGTLHLVHNQRPPIAFTPTPRHATVTKQKQQQPPLFTYSELFAGIGGFRCALDALGGSCVFASEIDSEGWSVEFM